MKEFIAENNLIKRLGLSEWYSPDNKVRLVKIGNRYRMDVRRKNWSTFRSDYIVGHREREFKAQSGRRRY